MAAIAMTFARMNPPTIGHQLIVDRIKRVWASPGVPLDRTIYLSPTTGKNDPLDFGYKYDIACRSFADMDVIVSEIQHKDVFAAVKWVYELGYAELHLVVGGDRWAELNKRIPMYNGQLYKFTTINVINAGKRDDSDGIAGMSASRLREAAKLGDYVTFESGLPPKLRSMSRDIYERVREACLSKVSETT